MKSPRPGGERKGLQQNLDRRATGRRSLLRVVALRDTAHPTFPWPVNAGAHKQAKRARD